MIRDAKRVSKCEECQRIHGRQLRELRTLNLQESQTVNKVLKSRSWLVLDRAEKRLREPFIGREQHSKILSSSWRCHEHVTGTLQCIVTKKNACAKLYTIRQDELGCQQE